MRAVQTKDQEHQLLVQGGVFPQRVAVLRLASELRDTVLKALFVPLERYPVSRPLLFLINPMQPPEIPASFEIIEDPGGLKIQLRLAALGEEVPPQLERTIVTALLTELAMRPSSPEERSLNNRQNTVLVPPRWLVDALLYKYHHREVFFSPVRLRPVFEGNKIPDPQLLLARPENDIQASTDEEIELALCMLWMLSNRPESRSSMKSILKADFTQEPARRLQMLFPSLGNTDASLQKEWTLAIAAYGTQEEVVALDGSATQREIERLLQLELTEPNTGRHVMFPLEQFSDFVRLPGSHGALLSRQLEWIALRERCHFLYSAVAETYAVICGELAQGKTAGIARRLREATLERESVSARLSRIRDYMNWYQAVAAPRQNSAKLREFYRILDEKPAVSETVTKALDKMEAQLREDAEREDIVRVLDEIRRRKSEAGLK